MKQKRREGLPGYGTPEQLARSLSISIRSDLEYILGQAADGKDIGPAIRDFADGLEAQIVRHRSQIVVSKIIWLNDEEYFEAWSDASQELYEDTGEDRDATPSEVESYIERKGEGEIEWRDGDIPYSHGVCLSRGAY